MLGTLMQSSATFLAEGEEGMVLWWAGTHVLAACAYGACRWNQRVHTHSRPLFLLVGMHAHMCSPTTFTAWF